MKEKFTWIPFYMEFAKKLLKYIENRTPLVNWIYDNLDAYISHLKIGLDKSRLPDIDPFSVMAICGYSLYIRTLDLNTDLEAIKKRLESFIDQ